MEWEDPYYIFQGRHELFIDRNILPAITFTFYTDTAKFRCKGQQDKMKLLVELLEAIIAPNLYLNVTNKTFNRCNSNFTTILYAK